MTKIIENLYITAYRIREVELEISKKYSEKKMRCPTHLSVGQEGVSSAFSQIAKKKDFAVSTHRAHAHYLAKGGSLKKMIAEIYGKKTGCSNGKGGSMHLIDLKCNFMGSSAIVGNSIPIGVGLALSAKMRKTSQVSYVFLGDGAVEEGVFYESLNFSIVKKLPVIFICENNLYSVYSPLSVRQPKKRSISKMCSSIGVKSLKCDGNDAMKVFNILGKITNQVRNSKEPFFLELDTYRWLEHCGPNYDNDIGYRSKNEFLKWKKKDPLEILRSKLPKKSLKKIEFFEKKIKKEIKSAFNFAEKSPFPSKSSAYEGLYAK